jgi:hypothetical protein
VLEEQIGQVRKKIKTHADGGLHTLRRTFLTEAESTRITRIPLRCSMSPETIT